MSQDFPNRKQWLARRATPASLHRTRVNRIVYAGAPTSAPVARPRMLASPGISASAMRMRRRDRGG